MPMAQSTLQVDPLAQLVLQLPSWPLHATLQVVLAPHWVVQAPPGQSSAQGWDGELQVSSQALG